MYLKKSSDEILRQALSKVTSSTRLTATSPGSVVRTIAEMVSTDLGDFFSTLDFNIKQASLGTASGRALDLWGSLYNLPRKTLSTVSANAAVVGSFYFYLDTPAPTDITIPRGTRVATTDSSVVGTQFAYATTEDVTIAQGRLRGYVTLVNVFSDSMYTAERDTLVTHSFTPPSGVTVKCTNPKAIQAQQAFETDAEYKTRLIAEVRRQAGGTSLSMRLSALAVNGVRNVVIRDATFGLGSIEVIVSCEDYNNNAGVMNNVKSAVQAIKPPGVRVYIREPTLMELGVNAVLTIKRIKGTQDEQVLYRAKNSILRYINTLGVGDPIVYNRLISEILQSSEEVTDVTFSGFSINGSEILRKNYGINTDEQVIPGNIETRFN